MNRVLGILFIILIIGGLVLLINDNSGLSSSGVQDEIKRTKAMIVNTFDTGDSIGFDNKATKRVEQGVIYVDEQQVQSNSTVVNSTQNVVEPISNDNADVIQICKQGQRCEITGKIVLVDPKTGESITDLIRYTLEIDCDYRDWCTLSPSLATRGFTDSSGYFKYVWTTNSVITLDEYRVTVLVTSEHLDSEGNPIHLQFSKYIRIV